MNPHEVIVGVLTGSVLIVFGLVPGIFQGLTDGTQNYLDLFSSRLLMRPPRHAGYNRVERPIWLAGLGVALIVLILLAYMSE